MRHLHHRLTHQETNGEKKRQAEKERTLQSGKKVREKEFENLKPTLEHGAARA